MVSTRDGYLVCLDTLEGDVLVDVFWLDGELDLLGVGS